jgi:hypothetical protein
MTAPAESRGDGGGRVEQGELFERQFSAAWPSQYSRGARVLRALLTGSVTQPDWLHGGEGWRLTAAINELRALGWPVEAVSEQFEGRSRQIARYSLPEWVLREVAGATGRG